MDRSACVISVSGLVWGSAGSRDLLAAVQCSRQHYLFLPCLGSGSHSPSLQPALPHTGTVVHPLTGRRLLGQVSSPCKLDLFFQPENRHFPFIPLSTREHCKEPQCLASPHATQSHVCSQEPSSLCSAFVIRKTLVNPPDLSLLRPGRLILSLDPWLQLLFISEGIWLLFLLAWAHCYLRETCNFMEPPPPKDGH